MSIREQLEGVAATVPMWLVIAGGVGGALIAIGNLVSLRSAMAEGRSGFELAGPVLAIAFGALLAAYFGYLGHLKERMKRDR